MDRRFGGVKVRVLRRTEPAGGYEPEDWLLSPDPDEEPVE